jgi:hypothetical protein
MLFLKTSSKHTEAIRAGKIKAPAPKMTSDATPQTIPTRAGKWD